MSAIEGPYIFTIPGFPLGRCASKSAFTWSVSASRWGAMFTVLQLKLLFPTLLQFPLIDGADCCAPAGINRVAHAATNKATDSQNPRFAHLLGIRSNMIGATREKIAAATVSPIPTTRSTMSQQPLDSAAFSHRQARSLPCERQFTWSAGGSPASWIAARFAKRTDSTLDRATLRRFCR